MADWTCFPQSLYTKVASFLDLNAWTLLSGYTPRRDL